MARSASSPNRAAPAWRTPAIIGGVVVLPVIAGVLFALTMGRDPGIGSGDPSPPPTPTPTPTATPTPTGPASPSQDPSPSETPASSDTPSAPAEPSGEAESPYLDPVVADPDGVLPPGGVVRVIADSLRVRDHALLRSAERMMLQRGDLLIVGPTFEYGAFGPVVEDGYTWYPVAVLGIDELPEPGREPMAVVDRGWVAIGDGESEWLELLGPRCTDDEPTLQHLSSLTEWERLACYGDRQITFEGIYGCGGCGGMVMGTFTPEWLAWPMNAAFISVEPLELIGPLALRWSPDGPEPPSTPGVAPILRVTGHFDDAAAESCSMLTVTGTFGVQSETQIDPAISELYCRSQFVVDSYEITGEDEDFPFG